MVGRGIYVARTVALAAFTLATMWHGVGWLAGVAADHLAIGPASDLTIRLGVWMSVPPMVTMTRPWARLRFRLVGFGRGGQCQGDRSGVGP